VVLVVVVVVLVAVVAVVVVVVVLVLVVSAVLVLLVREGDVDCVIGSGGVLSNTVATLVVEGNTEGV
jgi:hypothetical protein